MEANKILFRCSSLGTIMTAPRSVDKSKISETCYKELQDIWIYNKYGISNNISSKPIDNGILQEEDSVTLYSKLKKDIFILNNERFSNEFITGKPDIITEDSIIDIKTSSSIHSFTENSIEYIRKNKINRSYYLQLQGYMDLLNKDKAILVYCLTNKNQEMYDSELKSLSYKYEGDLLNEREENLRLNSVFDNIPLSQRIFEITIERDKAAINEVYEKIPSFREEIAKIDLLLTR